MRHSGHRSGACVASGTSCPQPGQQPLEYRGFATEWDRVVVRGDLGGREAIVFWVADGRVVAAMNLNVWDVGEPIERLLRARPVIDDRKLADPDVELGALVAGADR